MPKNKELIRQIKRFLNSERVAYINTTDEVILILNGQLCSIITEDGDGAFIHNGIRVKVNSLKEFISIFRGYENVDSKRVN